MNKADFLKSLIIPPQKQIYLSIPESAQDIFISRMGRDEYFKEIKQIEKVNNIKVVVDSFGKAKK